MQTLQQFQTNNKNVLFMNKNVVFRSYIDFHLITHKKVQQNFGKMKWWIINGSYNQNNWKLIFFEMISCSAMVLYFNNNQNQNIIKEIAHVEFVNLQILVLSGNNIENIQWLSQINCSNLTTLNLYDNKIFKMSNLYKTSNSKINFLTLNKNPFLQIKTLSRMHFNLQFISKLVLQYQKDECIIQDLSNLAKLSSKTIQKLFISQKQIAQQIGKGSTRIIQQKVQWMLNLKCLEMQISKN